MLGLLVGSATGCQQSRSDGALPMLVTCLLVVLILAQLSPQDRALALYRNRARPTDWVQTSWPS